MKKLILYALILGVLFFAGCASNQTIETTSTTSTQEITTTSSLKPITTTTLLVPLVPAEVTTYASDWPLPNKDYANTRETKNSPINTGNVKNMVLVWSFDIPGISEWGAAASNPLILGDKVFFQDLMSNIFVLDLKTGKTIWEKNYNMTAYGPNGIVVGYGKVFAPKGHYEIAALDAEKGNEIWSTKLSDQETVGVDIQPTIYNGKVYLSTVPGTENSNFYTGGGMGIIYSVDQNTGEITWSFNTIGEDLWGNKEVNSGGGAWYTPAVDTNTGVTYWGIGNPAPWPGTKEFPNGASRPGPNLYTDSLLALNSTNGKLIWYNQVIEHDLFDLDLQIPPILTTEKINGSDREIVIAAGKMGKVYAFDRKTGALLWKTPVGKHLNDELTILPEGSTRVYPGPLGGVETPMAYSDGVIYVPLLNLFADYTPTSLNGSTFNFSAGTGELVALNASNGKIIWDRNYSTLNVGGATIVNDLVFTATFDGTIYALNKKTGGERWRYLAPAQINAWPAVAGDTIIWPAGLGAKPSLIALRLNTSANQTTTTIKKIPGLPAGDTE